MKRKTASIVLSVALVLSSIPIPSYVQAEENAFAEEEPIVLAEEATGDPEVGADVHEGGVEQPPSVEEADGSQGVVPEDESASAIDDLTALEEEQVADESLSPTMQANEEESAASDDDVEMTAQADEEYTYITLGVPTSLKRGTQYRIKVPADGYLTMASNVKDAFISVRYRDYYDFLDSGTIAYPTGARLMPGDAPTWPESDDDYAWWGKRRGVYTEIGVQKGEMYVAIGADCTATLTFHADPHREYDYAPRPLSLSADGDNHVYRGTAHRDKDCSNSADAYTFTLTEPTKVQLQVGLTKIRPNLSAMASNVTALIVKGTSNAEFHPDESAALAKLKVDADTSQFVYEGNTQGFDFYIGYSSSAPVSGDVVELPAGTYTVHVNTDSIGAEYTLALINKSVPESPFVDVNAKTSHSADIYWLAESGISTGWTMADGTRQFRPMNTVIRQDMAAFLFREARLWGLVDDSWQPTGKVTFTDVTPKTPHYREIMWLAESGVSAGWTMKDGTKQFRPTNTVIRQDMAAFLRRMQALRDPSVASWRPSGATPFTDVSASTPHHEDVLWLAESGVSTGWSMPGGTKQFRPTNTVVRQDMAAFLQRLNALG